MTGSTLHPTRLSLARDHRRATVLIVVLWVSLGLVSVALLFGHSMLMVYRGSDNDLAGRQADQAIEGAVRYAESLLTSATTVGVLPDVTTYENEAVPVGEATFWFLGRQSDTGSSLNSKTRVYGLIDEASKLNLNIATNGMISNLPVAGMTPDYAQAIVDWRTPSTSGSTDSVNKQAPFESIEELALVTGATREILYGEDANLDGALEPNEDDSNTNLPDDNSDGKLDPGLLEYVTVFSRESNLQKDNKTPRINIQTGTDTLKTLLTDTLKKSDADATLIASYGTTDGDSLLSFYLKNLSSNGLTESEFAQIAYELTTTVQQQQSVLPSDTQKRYLTGLINVNTASQAVLATIFDASQVAAIISARVNHTQADTSYTWVADALGLKPGTPIPPPLISSLNRITGKCSQITADIAAVGRHGRGYRRVKVVIDNSTGTPRIVYRRNLAPLGWALDSNVRTNLAQIREGR